MIPKKEKNSVQVEPLCRSNYLEAQRGYSKTSVNIWSWALSSFFGKLRFFGTEGKQKLQNIQQQVQVSWFRRAWVGRVWQASASRLHSFTLLMQRRSWGDPSRYHPLPFSSHHPCGSLWKAGVDELSSSLVQAPRRGAGSGGILIKSIKRISPLSLLFHVTPVLTTHSVWLHACLASHAPWSLVTEYQLPARDNLTKPAPLYLAYYMNTEVIETRKHKELLIYEISLHHTTWQSYPQSFVFLLKKQTKHLPICTC